MNRISIYESTVACVFKLSLTVSCWSIAVRLVSVGGKIEGKLLETMVIITNVETTYTRWRVNYKGRKKQNNGKIRNNTIKL
jgi:hypothetical protein